MTHEQPQPLTGDWICGGKSMHRFFAGNYGQVVVEKFFPSEGVLVIKEEHPYASRHVREVIKEVDENSNDNVYRRSHLLAGEYVSFIDPEQNTSLIIATSSSGIKIGIDPEIQTEEPLANDSLIVLFYSEDSPVIAKFIVERAEKDTEAKFQSWQANAKPFVRYIHNTDPKILLSNKQYVSKKLQYGIRDAATLDEQVVIEESIKSSRKCESDILSFFGIEEQETAAIALEQLGFIEEFTLFLLRSNKASFWHKLSDKKGFLDTHLSVFIHKKIEELRATSMSDYVRIFTIGRFDAESFEWTEKDVIFNSDEHLLEQLVADDTWVMFTTNQISQGKTPYGESINIVGNSYVVQKDGNNFSVELTTPDRKGWTVRFPAALDAHGIFSKIKDLQSDFRRIRNDIQVEFWKK